MKCHFIFCLHDHQPVGNFDHVLEWGYKDCYHKTLQVLEKYPGFRFAVHHSGPLLEWIESHNPDYIETLKRMVARGQVEIIGGGFYEPIFSIISERDIRGQIGLMQEYCASRFNVRPKGFWTAERVWDPEIPRLVSGFGLDYTILDDNHFRYAGIEEEDLYGYFLTERLDHSLRVFPIDKYLRYSIPFHMPHETIAYFREKTERLGECAFVYGDDGEKFGMWPGTFDWVFGQNWLVNFIEAVLKEDWITMTLPSEYIAARPPRGRVYLTQGSYFELSEWALPSRVAAKMVRIHKEIKDSGREPDFYPFLKGGIWNNFLIKYPESNALNKRTLLLSQEIADLEKDGNTVDEAKRELYMSECNCAYWHGLFGGIYLTNLRHALYVHLLGAEALLARYRGPGKSLIEKDFWNEGDAQLLFRMPDFSAIVVPRRGGCMSEFGVYGEKFNIFDTIPRRYEAYHEDLKNLNEDEPGKNGEAVKSIHDTVTVKEKGLKRYLVYDNSRRYSFKDLLFGSMPDAENLMLRQSPVHDMGNERYEEDRPRGEAGADISLRARAHCFSKSPEIRKSYFFNDHEPEVRVRYAITGGEGLVFGVELNINLLGGHDEDRYYELPGVPREDSYLDAIGFNDACREFRMVDRYSKLVVTLTSTGDPALARYPIFTVSQSDRGFEKNYQGSSLVFLHALRGQTDTFELKVRIE
ncbi:MAG: DUF1926 domain-containing protein [Spirochaetes bacterium]|nr:MAG: DUF1926 domain-containing protein [Spirochaetota bacterium]